MIKLSVTFSLSILLFFACSKQNDVAETATSGNVKFAYDESFKSIARQEKDVFQYQYKYASVSDTMVPQEIAHQMLLRDSVKLIFSSRMLNENELAYLKSKNVFPKMYEFAEDGLVIILNRNNPDSLLILDEFRNKILSQKGLKLVVDNAKGSSLSSFLSSFGFKDDTLKNVYSADSTEGVISYVSENLNAIGIISSAWISDDENPNVQKLRSKIRIAKVSAKKDSLSYYPFQSEIADSLYPLMRKIYIISRESKMGIANGYASFLLGEKGQRIVLKAGLVPSRMPSREVVISKKDIR